MSGKILGGYGNDSEVCYTGLRFAYTETIYKEKKALKREGAKSIIYG